MPWVRTGYTYTFGPGSQTSVPSGLEATFVYNGLTINDRRSPDRYRVNQISGFDDADIRDSREVLSMQHGEVAYPPFYGGRTLTLKGEIQAGNFALLRDMQENLRTAFASLTELPLYVYSPWGGVADVMFQYVRKSAPIQMAETQANVKVMREFLITLRSSDPWMTALTATTTTVAAGSAGNITSIGNFYSYPVITITGGVSLVNPSVTIGSYTIGFTYSVPNGTTLVIDTRAKTIKNNSGVWMYSKATTLTDWPVILPGSNAVSITKSSGSGSVDIVWRPNWM